MPDPVDPHLQHLRVKAEKRLHELGHSNDFIGKRDEILEELRIYQAELEIQNQHLRETQEQLQHSLDRFNCLYQQSPVGYVTIDGQGQIHDVNESFAAMLGYPPDRLQRQYLAEYCCPESADVLRQRLPSFFRQPKDKVLDIALTTSQKKTLLVEIQGRLLPGELRLACNVIDRTQRKLAEIALANRTNELELRTAELERFNYTVSHDLKSPLVTINTFLGFLEQDMYSGDTTKINEDMQHMRTAAEHMSILLDDLLSLSRLGWVADQPEIISLLALLEHVLKMVQGQIHESGAQISLPDSDLQLYADPSQLLEIWQNLIDNAMKYAVGQDTTHIDIGFDCASETTFYVCDNGPGIASEYHQKIFGLFEKLDRNSQGSGLGLALVKRVIEKHGGKIWIESAGNAQGCCFKFTLPNATGPTEEKKTNRPGSFSQS